jgi:hypothetical protein
MTLKVLIDGVEVGVALNDVKVIVVAGGGFERHVTVSAEGIIEDLVRDGEVWDTMYQEHDELLDHRRGASIPTPDEDTEDT